MGGEPVPRQQGKQEGHLVYRDKKLTLHIRRRTWLTPEGKSFTAGTRPSTDAPYVRSSRQGMLLQNLSTPSTHTAHVTIGHPFPSSFPPKLGKNAQNAKFPAWLRLKHGKNRENVVFWSANPFAIHQKSLSLSWVTPMVCFSCVHLEKSRRSFKVGSVKQPFNKALSSILSGFQPARRGLFYWHKRPLPLGS